MILKPYSFNGTSLQSTDYTASFPRASANLQVVANPSYIKRASAVPVYAGKDYQPVVQNLEILMEHDFMTLFESLNTLFDTKDETPRQFICTDEEDSAKQYYVYATAKQVLGGHEGNMAVVSLAYDDPIWQSVTQNSQTWSTTSSTSTTDVIAAGNDNSYPIFEVTTGTGSVFLYTVPVQVLPQSTSFWANRFLDITGTTDTTWDTAALIAGGKMQASSDPGGAGADLRVFRDGVEVDRWLNGINTTDTHVIVSCDMPPARTMTLKTAIASTDTITEVELNYTTANKIAISAMPSAGRIIIDTSVGSTDTEEFTYTAKTVTDTKLAFTINARSVRGTSAFNHAVNDPVRHLPYDFTIVYGNLTAAAPTVDNTRKPIVDLTSRNSSLIYSQFYDPAGLRPNSWQRGARFVSDVVNSRSRLFTSTNDLGDTDPGTELGLAAYTYQAGGIWRSDSVELSWQCFFPDGIASISASGDQNQTASSIPITRLLATSDPYIRSSVFTEVWFVSPQSATDYGTWTTWTKATTDATLPADARFVTFYSWGTILGDTDYYSKLGISSFTVGITNYPTVHLRSETPSHGLDITIANDTTSESFRLVFPTATSETMYVDTDPDFPTVKHRGQIMNGAIRLSSIRAAWLKLQPGTNTLSYQTNNSTPNDVSIVIKWRDRANFL